jgi:hypothetical protein
MPELREAVARVLDAVEQKFGSTIDLDADFYWSVDPLESFDATIPLQQLVGSIVEDVEDTRDLLKREDWRGPAFCLA